MDAPFIQRKLRDFANDLIYTNKSIIFLSPEFKVPGDLSKSMTIIDMPLPDADELKAILKRSLDDVRVQEASKKAQYKEKPNDAKVKDALINIQEKLRKMEKQCKEQSDRIVSAGLGLSAGEYENVLAQCVVEGDLNIAVILAEKRQIIKQSGVLECIDTDETADSIGGLKVLKKHIRSTANRLTPEARKYGIDQPRGLLLLGVPGAGKSLTCKVSASVMNLQLVRLDVGALFGSLVGESESRVRRALKVIDAISPSILWIDEIEKGMAFGDGTGDSGTSQRVFATILTWMEEQKGTFVIATCNSQVALKAELMARFQKVFFVDIPTPLERAEILSIHLKKVGRDPAKFDIPAIVRASEGFVGREIRNITQDALSRSFDDNKREVTTDDFIFEFKKVKPITVQKKEDLEAMRAWANKYAINASEEEPNPEQPTNAQSKTDGKSRQIDTGLSYDDMIKG
jgi:ATP-dependent 26S proteasome regulatory subunit